MADVTAKLAVERLADYLAALSPTALRRQLGGGGEKIELFAHAADEQYAASVYSVVRAYGGRREYNPPPQLSVQVMTTAGTDADAMARADQLYAQLIDANGHPLRAVTVNGVIIDVLELQVPAKLGVRENLRVEAVFNFDLVYRPA